MIALSIALAGLAAFLGWLQHLAGQRADRAREDARDAQSRAHNAEMNERDMLRALETSRSLHDRLLARQQRRKNKAATHPETADAR